MELTTDVLLRGTAWNRAIDALSPIFRARPHYMLYMLSMSIGIMYDQRIQKPEENGEQPHVFNARISEHPLVVTLADDEKCRRPQFHDVRHGKKQRQDLCKIL